MNWRKFLIICAALIAVIFVFIFAKNQFTTGFVERQLAKYQRQIEARGDGSSLIYDLTSAKGKEVHLKRIIYQDGATGGRLALFNVEAQATAKSIEHLSASRLEWVNEKGNLLTVNQFDADDLTENRKATHPWNRYLFSRVQGEDLTLTGLSPSEDDVEVRAAQFALEDLTDDELALFALMDMSVYYTPEIHANIDELRVEDLDYGKIDEIVASIDAGYIPIKPLSELASTDLTLEGLELDLGDGRRLSADGSGVAEEDLLQLFLDYAPQDLRDIIGTSNGRELKSMLDALGRQDPNDLAIRGLEFMLDYLQSQRQ